MCETGGLGRGSAENLDYIGSPLHRGNRGNGLKISLLGKNGEFGNSAKTQGILNTQ